MFPEEEEKIAEAALTTFENARSSHAGRWVLHLSNEALILCASLTSSTAFSRTGSRAGSMAGSQVGGASIASRSTMSKSVTIKSFEEKSLSSGHERESREGSNDVRAKIPLAPFAWYYAGYLLHHFRARIWIRCLERERLSD